MIWTLWFPQCILFSGRIFVTKSWCGSSSDRSYVPLYIHLNLLFTCNKQMHLDEINSYSMFSDLMDVISMLFRHIALLVEVKLLSNTHIDCFCVNFQISTTIGHVSHSLIHWPNHSVGVIKIGIWHNSHSHKRYIICREAYGAIDMKSNVENELFSS